MATTLTTCVKITRRDTTVEGYTAHDQQLTVSGVDYEPSAGFFPSAAERTSSMRPDNQEILGIIDSVNLSEGDLLAGVYDGARVEIFVVDWTDTASGPVGYLLVGFLGSVTVVGSQYRVEFVSIESELQKPLGRVIALRCDADLGDARCGYTLVADSGTVTSVTPSTAKRVFIDTSLTAADGHYDGGAVTWTSGPNSGRTMDVKTYTAAADTVELYEPMPDAIAAGHAYDITQGCDKVFSTCRDTFSNEVNFRGFPFVPGVSDLIGAQTDDS